MVIVSFLGTANVILIIPFLEVLLSEQKAIPGEGFDDSGLSEFGEFEAVQQTPETSQAILEANERTVAAQAAEESPGSGTGFSFGDLIPESMKSAGEGFLAGPREAFGAYRDEAMAWYQHKAATNPYHLLILLAVILFSLTLVKVVAEYGMRYHLSYTFYLMTIQMKEDIYKNIMAQDYLFFTGKSPGYLINRVNSDVGEIKGIFNRLISDGVQQPLNLFFYSIALLWISPHLTLVSICLLPPVALMIYSFGKALKKNTRQQKKKADQLSGGVTESLYNIRLVKVFGTENLEVSKFVAKNRTMLKYLMRRRIAKFASGPIMELVGTIAACGVLLLGGYMILGQGGFLAGKLEAASFFAYLYLLTKFYRPLKSLSQATMGYQNAKVSAERIGEMMNLTPKVSEKADALPFKELRRGVEFRNVVLRYKEKEILKGVSLEIPRGKVVAIVGLSGAGKTSIANLMARLFDPSEGQILIDGADIRDYKISDLRQAMGFVTQQTILFDDTIANNITYGSSTNGISPEERFKRIVKAARAANAEEFIKNLDGGKAFDTKVGPGGARLSGGQSQRIAIARALYREPQLMIFDEATSALDNVSQAQVQEAINKILHERTSLVISHRLSTVRNADWIYVLEQGRIVEAGTHDELMSRRGAYHRLYQSEELKITA